MWTRRWVEGHSEQMEQHGQRQRGMKVTTRFGTQKWGCSIGWVLGRRTQAERGECRGTPAGYLRMSMSSVVLGPGGCVLV